MANEILVEQLDQAVEALIANGEAPVLRPDSEVASLLRLAVELRELPRENFKEKLRKDLEANYMSATAKSTVSGSQHEESEAPAEPIPAGYRTVTPYLVVREIHEVIDFIQTVFGAEGKIYGTGSEGGIHSEYRIGSSMLMIGGGPGLKRPGQPGALHIYVENVDQVYERAVQAGATSLHPPADQVYGERSAAFRDPGGNQWYPATYLGAHYIPEDADELMAYLHPRGAARQMDFLKQAFGAEEIYRGESPEGVIYHAKVRIGNSIVEMGEAHDQWQSMPAMFMMYVDDVDVWYARAMKAEGAVSIGEPANQDYGARTGGITDPFGNTWYIATQISR
jgi:PhnB protein